MFQRCWLKSWFSSWLMSYNWAVCLLLVSDERSPLIHSWSATFDGTCFNLRRAFPKLNLEFRFTDEAAWGVKNSLLKFKVLPFGKLLNAKWFSNWVELARTQSLPCCTCTNTGGVLCYSRELNDDSCRQVTPERSSESNVFWQLKMQRLHYDSYHQHYSGYMRGTNN